MVLVVQKTIDFTAAVHRQGVAVLVVVQRQIPMVVTGVTRRFMAVVICRTPSSWTSSARLAATFCEPSMANSCCGELLFLASIWMDTSSSMFRLHPSTPLLPPPSLPHPSSPPPPPLSSPPPPPPPTLYPFWLKASRFKRLHNSGELGFSLCARRWRVGSLVMAARVGAAGGTSSARRRRERRLRAWTKHERLSVAMALAEKLHHSANRTVLPKKEEVEQRARSYFFVSDECVPELAGEPQLQARMEDMGNVCPFMRILDLPVPQMGGHSVGVLSSLGVAGC